MSDGSTGYTQPWNVNITGLPATTPQSQWVMWAWRGARSETARRSKGASGSSISYGARFYFNYRRIVKTLQIYLLLAGPGIIVMAL